MGAPLKIEYIVDATTGCWNWAGHIMANGYGQKRDRDAGQATTAHRYMYKKLVGEIAPNRSLDHLCKNKSCVNPKHLEPVTQAENVRRGNMTKLTMEDADKIRRLLSVGRRQKDLAEKFHISRSVVQQIGNGTAWRHN